MNDHSQNAAVTMKLDEEVEIKKSFPILMFCFGVFGIPAGTAAFLGDYVLAGLLFATGLGCWVGFRTGALKALTSILLVLAAIYAAPQLLQFVEPKLKEWFEFRGLSNRIASMVVIVFAMGCLLTGIVSLVTRMAIKKDSTIETSNKLTGLLIGGIEAAVGILLLLGGLQVIVPMFDQQKIAEADTRFETLSDITLVTVADVSQRTKASLIGPVLDEHNPFTKYPEYNPLPKVQKTVQLLSNPSQINELMNDRKTMEKLHASDAFTTAVEKLSIEPTVQEILGSGEPPGPQQILALLNSQSVLEILDEPGFLEEATRILKESSVWGEQLSAN